MDKVSNIRRELKRRRRGCKHVYIKDTNHALNMNSENISTCQKFQSEKIEMQASKLEAKKKLMHTANQNCTLPSSGEQEQKPTLVVGQHAEKCVLAYAHAWRGGWT